MLMNLHAIGKVTKGTRKLLGSFLAVAHNQMALHYFSSRKQPSKENAFLLSKLCDCVNQAIPHPGQSLPGPEAASGGAAVQAWFPHQKSSHLPFLLPTSQASLDAVRGFEISLGKPFLFWENSAMRRSLFALGPCESS